MIDLRQTPEYAEYLRKIGWTTERIDKVNYAIKKFPLVGSIIKIQRPAVFNNETIKKLSHKYRSFQIIFEPVDLTNNQQLTTNNYKLSKSPYLPSKTIHLDLTQTEKMLLKQMRPKTRYNIKIAKRNGVEIKPSKDANLFSKLWHKFRRSHLLFLSLSKEITCMYQAFNKRTNILFAYHNDTIVACLMLVYSDELAYYMFAAASGEGKKLFAPTLLTWEAVKLAKKKGYKIFDFEGIYDERFPIPSWKGFSRFKQGFGGVEIKYPGAFTKTTFRNLFR
jgi:lipid II:glycine glycyltransferase (peptidoglycan interpeptide bridge formation enzyme)